MKVSVTVEVEDTFEKGCCQSCPFSYLDWDARYEEFDSCCVIVSHYEECPLEVVEE